MILDWGEICTRCMRAHVQAGRRDVQAKMGDVVNTTATWRSHCHVAIRWHKNWKLVKINVP